MSLRPVLSSLTLLALAACAAAPRPAPVAYGYGTLGGVVIDRAPLPFDPAPLPPNTAPGDCVLRTPQGWTGCGQRLAYGTLPAYGYSSDYGSGVGYAYSGHGYVETVQAPAAYGYGYGPPPAWGYRTAGRDAQGYLVWPGKTPR